MKALKFEAGTKVKMPKIVEISRDNLIDDIYSHINCRCFDIVTVQLYGETYFMFVDDEGLLKDDPQINFIGWYLYSELNQKFPIVGDAILLGVDSEGSDSVSLTDYQVNEVTGMCDLLLSSGMPFLYGLTIDD